MVKMLFCRNANTGSRKIDRRHLTVGSLNDNAAPPRHRTRLPSSFFGERQINEARTPGPASQAWRA
jgi:hypothetical protein